MDGRYASSDAGQSRFFGSDELLSEVIVLEQELLERVPGIPAESLEPLDRPGDRFRILVLRRQDAPQNMLLLNLFEMEQPLLLLLDLSLDVPYRSGHFFVMFQKKN